MLKSVPVVADGPAAEFGLRPGEAADSRMRLTRVAGNLIFAHIDLARYIQPSELALDGATQMPQPEHPGLVLVESVAGILRGAVVHEDVVRPAPDIRDRPEAFVLMEEERVVDLWHREAFEVLVRLSKQREMHALVAVVLIQPGDQERDGLGVAARLVLVRELEHRLGLDVHLT